MPIPQCYRALSSPESRGARGKERRIRPRSSAAREGIKNSAYGRSRKKREGTMLLQQGTGEREREREKKWLAKSVRIRPADDEMECYGLCSLLLTSTNVGNQALNYSPYFFSSLQSSWSCPLHLRRHKRSNIHKVHCCDLYAWIFRFGEKEHPLSTGRRC